MKYLLICVTSLLTACSSYVYQAYFHKTNTSIRGYPTISPPETFNGVWIDYKWNGKKLAEVPYKNGKASGTSYWYRDDGKPYLIREYKNGRFLKDHYIEPIPKTPAKIPFWFPNKGPTFPDSPSAAITQEAH